MAGQAAEIDRPAHIVTVIGAPSTDLDGRARFRTAAAAIESSAARRDDRPNVPADSLDSLSAAKAEELAEVRSAVRAVATLDAPRADTAMELA